MKPRVLIVDASLTVRMELAEAFQEAGFDAAPCRTLDAARAASLDRAPAVIVIGHGTCERAGVPALAALRAEAAPVPPLLLLATTGASPEDIAPDLAATFDACIPMPEVGSTFVVRVQELLAARGRLVLLIDDSRTFREHLGEILARAGYRVVLAESGEHGLRSARALRPDAIVVDGVMSGMSGTAVVRALRVDPELRLTPCLLLTATEGLEQEVSALDAGADAYVRKTEDTDVVLARLAAMLRAAGSSTAPGQAQGTGPGRILAVDDSTTYLAELEEQLDAEGYVVTAAVSGEQALARLEQSTYDCVLLDLVMPGLSGTETCRAIKEQVSLRGLPVMMLTAMADPEAMIEGINAGADDYIVKSSDFEVLKARLRAMLRRKRVEEENRRVRDQIVQKEAEARAATALAETRSQLLRQVEEKNEALSFLNRELQMFAYSVSHDLRQPLRSLDGFSEILLQEYGALLDERGRHYLDRVRAGAQRMGKLVDGLLVVSRVSRREMRRETVDLAATARRVNQRLSEGDPHRAVVVEIEPEMVAYADPDLIELVYENLLGNAWKFTSKRDGARVKIGVEAGSDRTTYFVSDNGVGFDMRYVGRIFGVFQRLHSEEQFSGTGIGLATVQRIVHRHGGDVWAEGKPDEGATFRFSLGKHSSETPS
jgi:two-component system, NtrC family, sensor kinase